MHLVIHTQYYPPEIGAPQTRLHELALHLVRHGITVTVLTAMPNYPRGRVYDGYGGWSRAETLDGIKIIRSMIYPYQGVHSFPRLVSYFSFIFSSLWVGFWKVKKADFVITESPPLFLGIAGFLLSRLKQARWIFNVSDLWPRSAVELGVIREGGWGNKLGGLLEAFLYRSAWMITCQSRGILENIQGRFPEVSTYLLPNGVDTEFFQMKEEQPEVEDFQVVYAGLHGLAQGLDQILLAAQKLQTTERIHFTFIGDGPEKKKLIQFARYLKLENVRFLAPLSKKEIPTFLHRAQAILVPLKIQLTGAVPSKLYEAMAMGKPVILMAGGEAAQIVRESRCGIVVSPGDVHAVVDAIRFLKAEPLQCKQMGRHGRDAAVRQHNRKTISECFAKYLIAKRGLEYE